MKKQLLIVSAALIISSQAFALEQITRPYYSARMAGMGGVRLTTGLYDDNFFGNPARVMANPKWRVSVLDFGMEANAGSMSNLGTVMGSSDVLKAIGETAGTSNHIRVQTIMPSVFIPLQEKTKMSFALGMVSSTQFDAGLRRNFRISPQGVMDASTTLTVGRTFLPDDRLAVGLNARYGYRLSTTNDIAFSDFLSNSSGILQNSASQGTQFAFDLGSTYRMPFTWQEFDFLGAVTINNIFDSPFAKTTMLSLSNPNATDAAPQSRALGFGMVGHREKVGPFSDLLVALEITDIGPNGAGSPFRLLHIGAEARYGVLSPRLGLNQGYLTIGLGINLKVVSIEYAYYAEEMSLNVGGTEDRRHALRLTLLQI